MIRTLIKITIISLLAITSIFCFRTYSYWDINTTTIRTELKIGSINYINTLNLNIWEDNNILNQEVPVDTIFSYNNDLYIVRAGETYNPHYHGLPGEGGNQWAYVALELEWKPNMNYRTNSVVIRSGRYFIANSAYNTDDWFVNDPLTKHGKPWSEWREIEPIDESHFGNLPNSNLKDYANPDFNYIIYK